MRELAQLRKEQALMKRRTPEEIVLVLREAEGSGESVVDFCRRKGISDQTFYRWRQQYGGLEVEEAKRLKLLEVENAKLKKLVAEILLANEGLKEILSKK